MMKAVRYSQFGGPEVLEIVDLPDPHGGPGQVRVTVHAVGVNPTSAVSRYLWARTAFIVFTAPISAVS